MTGKVGMVSLSPLRRTRRGKREGERERWGEREGEGERGKRVEMADFGGGGEEEEEEVWRRGKVKAAGSSLVGQG